MSEEQVEIEVNSEEDHLNTVPVKEIKKEKRHELKEEKHENKEKKKKDKKNYKLEKKKELKAAKKAKKLEKENEKLEKKLIKSEQKIEKDEKKIEEKLHHHHHHHHHDHDHNIEENHQIERTIEMNTISEENDQVQNRNIPLNSEWKGIISCDPSEIPDDISLSLSSVTPDQIPDDISISMSEFNESNDNIKVSFPKNNLTESDLSPELELKDRKAIPGSQPNVGEKGAFESNYYLSSESKHEDNY